MNDNRKIPSNRPPSAQPRPVIMDDAALAVVVGGQHVLPKRGGCFWPRPTQLELLTGDDVA